MYHHSCIAPFPSFHASTFAGMTGTICRCLYFRSELNLGPTSSTFSLVKRCVPHGTTLLWVSQQTSCVVMTSSAAIQTRMYEHCCYACLLIACRAVRLFRSITSTWKPTWLQLACPEKLYRRMVRAEFWYFIWPHAITPQHQLSYVRSTWS